MERLQAAIDKARAQRDGMAPVAQKTNEAEAGQTGTKRAARKTEAPAGQDSVSLLWQALQPIAPTGLLRGGDARITTLKAGPGSAPFDILRTRILHQAETNGWRRIAITSPHAGCGKTLTTANLAFSFARQAEMRTLVFDFDMRRPKLGRILGQAPANTMGDVISGQIPFARHAMRHGDNLAFGLNSGPVKLSAELLQSNQTRDLLAGIEAEYRPDILLFDVPPLRSTDDSIGFLRHVDAAIIIAAAEETPMSQIDVAERQVAELTNVMGVVLNKCRIMDGEYGYESDGA